MYCRLPAKSAKASSLGPIGFRKPGGPPRCWMYGRPSALAVARKKVSIASRNWRRSGVISDGHSRPSNILRDPRRACSALTEAENRTSSVSLISVQLLAEFARHFLDELPGDAARARAARDRPLDGALAQLLGRHAELVVLGVGFDHGEEGVLVGVVEAQPQAEAIRQRDFLFDSFRRIDRGRALVLDHVAWHQVAAVRRGVEHDVVRPALDAAV